MSNQAKPNLSAAKEILRARMAELREEIAAVMAPTAAKRVELEALVQKQNELSEAIATLSAEIDAAEQPKLHELKQELAEVARAEIAIKLPR